MRNFFFCTVLLAVCHSNLLAISPYEAGDTLHVWASAGLRLRDKPDGRVVAILSFGEQVVVQQDQPTRGQHVIEKLAGHWVKVRWKGQTGYVFDGFLGWLPTPAADQQDLLAYANANFNLVSTRDSSGAYSSVWAWQEFRYRGFRITYTNSSGEGPDLYWSHGELAVEDISIEEMYLLFYFFYKNDPDVAALLQPDRQEYPSDDESSNVGFESGRIYWNWSH